MLNILQSISVVKSEASISAIIDSRLQLKDGKCRCPFHLEKTPSFNVSEAKSLYRCFGCGAHGDVIDFVMQYENVGIAEALNTIADELNLKLISKDTPQSHANTYTAVETAQALFVDNYATSSRAQTYMHSRGFNDQVLKSFGVGLGVSKTLMAGIRPLLKSGLLSAGGRAIFENRVTLPIYDKYGLLCGFTARSIDGTEPKYINTSNSQTYSKDTTLFGFQQAKQHIKASKTALIMEGALDVVAAHQLGITNAVGVLGTALSGYHVKTLKDLGVECIEFCFDNDRAGADATIKSLNLVEAVGVQTCIMRINTPDFADALKAADFEVRYTPEAEFRYQHALEGLDVSTPDGLASFAKKAFLNLSDDISNPVCLELKQLIAQRTNSPIEAVNNALHRLKPSSRF